MRSFERRSHALINDGSTPSPPDPRRHIKNLTGIRAIAAAWVMVFHFQDAPVVKNVELGVIADFGYLGVDVFFVLSGFILAWNYGDAGSTLLQPANLRRFVIKRFARIYPLHLATFLLVVALWGFARLVGFELSGETEYSAWTAIANVLNLHAWGVTEAISWNGPSWSISAEWFAYVVLFPLIMMLLAHRHLLYSVMAAVGTWLAFSWYLAAQADWDLNQVAARGVLRIIPEFLAGYALYRLVADGTPRRSDLWLLAGIAVLSGVLIGRPSAAVLVLPAVALIIVGLYSGGPLTDRLFGRSAMIALGEISYSMYMVHTFVSMVANQLLGRLTTTSPMVGLVALMAMLGVTVAAGFAAHRLLEAPARRWLVARFG